MKISDLENHLAEIRAKHGDLEVIGVYDGGVFEPIKIYRSPPCPDAISWDMIDGFYEAEDGESVLLIDAGGDFHTDNPRLQHPDDWKPSE